MYITSVISPSKKQDSYVSTLLRESYRKGDKVKTRTIANLSHLPIADIDAMRLALKHKDNLSVLGSTTEEVSVQKGRSVGAVSVIAQMAKRLGITDALGNSFQGQLAMFQIIARVIEQGSRLSAVRMAESHAATEVLGLTRGFDENDLYENLHWLADKQHAMEESLFRYTYQEKPSMYLYDVTSSYLEGTKNALAEFGYNRDKKRGKKQIVIGLLCASDGDPVAIEVFSGNTQDQQTVASQIKKMAERFSCDNVTFVGDRGMVKSLQVDQLKERDFHYITAITKPQVRSLLKADVLQISLFDSELCDVEDGGKRYVFRRNPIRAQEIEQVRTEKEQKVRDTVSARNKYLQEHPRAKQETQLNVITALIKKLRLEQWMSITVSGRTLQILISDQARQECSELDGCYVLKTDLKKEDADTKTVHDRYKDLAFVEDAFRTMKTTHLEIRPVHVRSEKSTRGHVLVTMLAYKIIRTLTAAWKEEDCTVSESITILAQLCAVHVTVGGGSCLRVPQPCVVSARLLNALGITLPDVLPARTVRVGMRKKW